MSKLLTTDLKLERPDFVPVKDYEIALQGLKMFNKQEAARQDQLKRDLDALWDKVKAKRIALVGQELYDKFMAVQGELRTKFLKAEGDEKAQYQINNELKAFIERANFPIDKFSQIFLDSAQIFYKIIDASNGPVGETKKELDINVGEAMQKNNGNCFDKYNNPWSALRFGTYARWNGYTHTNEHGGDAATGRLDSKIGGLCRNGDGFDEIVAHNHTLQEGWVHSGNGGILRAFVLYKLNKVHHNFNSIDEEWVFSNAYHRQENHGMFHVIHPHVTGWRRTLLTQLPSQSLRDHHDRQFIEHRPTSPGEYMWGVMDSRNALPANQWVYVRFGHSLNLDGSSENYKINTNMDVSSVIETMFIMCNP